MEVTLIAATSVELVTFMQATRLSDFAPSKVIDALPRTSGPLYKYFAGISATIGSQVILPEATGHASFTFAISGTEKVLSRLMGSGVGRLLHWTEIKSREESQLIAIVSGNFDVWKTFIFFNARSHLGPECRQIVNEIQLQLEGMGLMQLFEVEYRKIGLADGTFILESK